jgi:hypothetical protein
MTSIGSRVFRGGVVSGSRVSALALAMLVGAACSSSSGGDAGTNVQAVTCASPGGPVSGPPDMHCSSSDKQPTDLASCHPDVAAGDDSGDEATDDGGGPGDGGPTGDCDPAEFGPTMYGYTGSDDDCKYDVNWKSTDICEGGNGVVFTVSATKRVDGTPLTGAQPYIEAVQSCAHPSPNAPPPAVENPPGTYTIGPIVFDTPGTWVVRFHFYGSCDDTLPTSPHGHAAFFINVP